MSLESGTTLWRLNHVLFPEPGSPIASTTIPLGARAAAAGAAGSFGGAVAATGAGTWPSASAASEKLSSDPPASADSAGTTVIDPLTAAGVKA